MVEHDIRHEAARMSLGLTPELPDEEMRGRRQRLREAMRRDGVDTVLVFGSPIEPTWIRYLANYVHPFVLDESFVVFSQKTADPIFLIDRPWFIEQAREMSRIKDIRIFPYVEFPWAFDELVKLFGGLLAELGAERGTVGICHLDMPAIYYRALTRALPHAQIEDVTQMLNGLLEHKTEYDRQMIRRAARIADAGMVAALNACGQGVPEYRVGFAAEEAMAAAGGEFGTGVTVRTHIYVASASQIRSNVRPYKYTARPLEKGDMFFIDLSSSYRGYYADFCRTVMIGKPSPEQQRMYDCTMATHKRMMEAMRPGISGEELFRLGQAVAVEWGYRENDINNVWLGHATGMILSEPPFFAEGEKRTVRANTFVNIEPGIFIPRHGSTSVEDSMWVTDSRVELVTQAPRELHVA
ncbi:MAG: M24 family metallopeptidase [Armatimonadota bacterium]